MDQTYNNTSNINMSKYAGKLMELSKLIKDEISIIENGGKLSSFKRQIKPRERQLRNQLKQAIKDVAKTGAITEEDWINLRNYFIIMIKELLDGYNTKWPDCKTFEDQKQIILQYLVFFDKPPFTIQRIAEVMIEPEKYYKSTKKVLYAFEKLVNVSDPEQR